MEEECPFCRYPLSECICPMTLNIEEARRLCWKTVDRKISMYADAIEGWRRENETLRKRLGEGDK